MVNWTHRGRGAHDARNDIEKHGLNFAISQCQRFSFNRSDLDDGGFSYASAYIAAVANFGGPL